jgi:hypothetical protein
LVYFIIRHISKNLYPKVDKKPRKGVVADSANEVVAGAFA